MSDPSHSGFVDIKRTAAGLVLPVKASPGARRNGITGVHAGRLKIAVTQAPEKGKANQALIELLAAALGVRRSQITLVAGETGSRKSFLIAHADPASVEARLRELIQLASTP